MDFEHYISSYLDYLFAEKDVEEKVMKLLKLPENCVHTRIIFKEDGGIVVILTFDVLLTKEQLNKIDYNYIKVSNNKLELLIYE